MKSKVRARLLVVGCFLVAAAPASALDRIYLVRHAEKTSEWPNEPALDPYRPLTEAGRAWAERLTRSLSDAGIAAIYTSRTTRAIETAIPLSTRQDIPVIADPATAEPDAMVEFLRWLSERHRRDRAVLIVGHTNTIPKLLVLLGATPDCHARLQITGGSNGLLVEGYEDIWRADLEREGCDRIVRERLRARE